MQKNNSNTEKLSKAFSTIICQWLNQMEIDEVIRLNFTPEYMDSCATHNFCDANEAMAEAMWKLLGREVDTQLDEDTQLWNDAWTMAKENGFYVKYYMIFDVKGAKSYSDNMTWDSDSKAKKFTSEEYVKQVQDQLNNGGEDHVQLPQDSACIQTMTFYKQFTIVCNGVMRGSDHQSAIVYDKNGDVFKCVPRGIIEKISLEEKAIKAIETKLVA